MSGRRIPRSVPPKSDTAVIRLLQITIIVLAATLAGGVAGVLSWACSVSIPGALLTAGATFASTTAVLLGLANFARAR